MSGGEDHTLSVAQFICSKTWLLLVLATLLALLGFLLPRYQPYFFSFEHGNADLRTRILSPSHGEQYKDIVLIKITETELEQMTYRSPIDRAWLSNLVNVIDRRDPAVIAIDILIDQPTEPEKDALLLKTLMAAQSPIVLASVDKRSRPTPNQTIYNSDFIKATNVLSGFVNFSGDEDDIIRELPRSIDPDFPHSFADVVVEAATGTLPPKPKFKERISWLKSIDQQRKPFPGKPAGFVLAAPAELNLEGKIVLIGADLKGIDKHKTPFADQGRVKSGTSGTEILAQVIAQRLDGRRITMLPEALEFILYLIAAFSGFLISASAKAISQKAKIISIMGIAALTIDVFFFKFLSVLIPMAMVLLTLGFAVGLPALFVKITGLINFIFGKKRTLS